MRCRPWSRSRRWPLAVALSGAAALLAGSGAAAGKGASARAAGDATASPRSPQSLDHLPNPVVNRPDPYVPTNRPAVGDMFDYFDFSAKHTSAEPKMIGGHGARRDGAAPANTAPALR
jgi:hypothetical protein